MSNIEWTDKTWNPVIGCAKVADGCKHCYAEKMSKRLAAMGQTDYASILDGEGRFNGKAITRPDTLDKPLRWRKPRTVFVNSMSDLFHKDVPFEFIAAVYGVMAACPQHTFQILTKRPERMLEFFAWVEKAKRGHWHAEVGALWDEVCIRAKDRDTQFWSKAWQTAYEHYHGSEPPKKLGDAGARWPWPLPNVWHGTSIANQKDADKNIPILLQVPSAVRFISYEPAVGEVDLTRIVIKRKDAGPNVSIGGLRGWHGGAEVGRTKLDWVIVGGESGPLRRGSGQAGARPCDIAWIRSIIQQCKAAGVPCFVKQLGSDPVDNRGVQKHDFCLKLQDRKGGDPAEWPEDIRVREYPAVKAES